MEDREGTGRKFGDHPASIASCCRHSGRMQHLIVFRTGKIIFVNKQEYPNGLRMRNREVKLHYIESRPVIVDPANRNASSEVGFLSAAFSRCTAILPEHPVIDTLALSRRTLPRVW
jgi:hypothetical protein